MNEPNDSATPPDRNHPSQSPKAGPHRPYPNLTPEYFRSIERAFRTTLPDALPHRHRPEEDLCTKRECLRESSHTDYMCHMIPEYPDNHCYDENGAFRCKSRLEGLSHCARKPLAENETPP